MSDVELAWANCVRGVLDGVLEDLPFSTLGHGSAGEGRAAGAVTVMQRAREIGIPFVTLTKGDHLIHVSAPDQAKAQMRSALHADAGPIGPRQAVPIGNRDRLAWWRIDQKTGEAIGMTDAGLHQGVFETMVETLESMNQIQQLLTLGAFAFVLLTGILAVAQVLQVLLCLGANPPAPGWWRNVPQRIPCIR